MSDLVTVGLALGGMLVVLGVFLAGRAMRGHWWYAGDNDEDEDLAGTGFSPPKPRERWRL